jgi:hypothetical protein
MRLNRNVVKEREAFVTNFCTSNVKATIREVQAAVTAKYVKQMSPNRILQLRKAARETVVQVPTVTDTSVQVEVNG